MTTSEENYIKRLEMMVSTHRVIPYLTPKDIKTFIQNFTKRFDINNIKDRGEHVYKEGSEAEDTIINYLKEELENL